MKKNKVLMLGPARNVKGGMTTVVDGYFNAGLQNKVSLKYIETVNDNGNISKILKMLTGFFQFIVNLPFYKIIHIHMASRMSSYRKGIYVRISKIFGKKVILHIHGAEYKIFYGKECSIKQKKYVRKTLKLADNIIVLSEEWKEYFETLVDKNKIVILYNAIILPKDFDKNLDTYDMLFLGRIGDRKGIFDLIDVLKELVLEYPSLKLYVGGDGEVEKLQKIIKKNNLEKNIKYIGWVSENKKSEYLKKASYYILPSYNEGMPMSVLEGMAYKNVTISTNVGGISKIIKNNYNGIMIEPGDKEALKKSLVDLFNNSKKREKLSINARKTIEEKFNADKNIIELIRLYNK